MNGSTTIDTVCYTAKQNSKILQTLMEYDVLVSINKNLKNELAVTDSLFYICKKDVSFCDDQKEIYKKKTELQSDEIRRLKWSRALFIGTTVITTLIAILK